MKQLFNALYLLLVGDFTKLSAEIKDGFATSKSLFVWLKARGEALHQIAKDFATSEANRGRDEAKSYADAQDAVNLNEAKTYADGKAASEANRGRDEAKSYADLQDAAKLIEAKSYADDKAIAEANRGRDEAKTYADARDVITLDAAKSHANALDSANRTQTTSDIAQAKLEGNVYTDGQTSVLQSQINLLKAGNGTSVVHQMVKDASTDLETALKAAIGGTALAAEKMYSFQVSSDTEGTETFTNGANSYKLAGGEVLLVSTNASGAIAAVSTLKSASDEAIVDIREILQEIYDGQAAFKAQMTTAFTETKQSVDQLKDLLTSWQSGN